MTGEAMVIKIVSENISTGSGSGGGGGGGSSNILSSFGTPGKLLQVALPADVTKNFMASAKAMGAIGGAIAVLIKGINFIDELSKTSGMGAKFDKVVNTGLKILSFIIPNIGLPLLTIYNMAATIVKKIAENSELMKGYKKVMSEGFGAIGDTILYGLYTSWMWFKDLIKPVSDAVGGAIGEFWAFIKDPMGYLLKQIESIGKHMTMTDIFGTNSLSILDYLTLPDLKLKDLFGTDLTGAISKFKISDYITLPTWNIKDLFVERVTTNFLKLGAWITMPNYSVSQLFRTDDQGYIPKLKLMDLIILPGLRSIDLFAGVPLKLDFNLIPKIELPDGTKIGFVEGIKKLIKDATDDIFGG